MSTPTAAPKPVKPAASSGGGGCLLPILWLILLGLAILLHNQVPVLRWATETDGGYSGHLAGLLRFVLRPPASLLLFGTVVLFVLVVVLEGAWAAWGLMLSTMTLPKEHDRVYVRIRIPRPESSSIQDTGMSLLRALHEVLPPIDGGPWLSLILHTRPDEPVELGIAVVGGMTRQRATWIAAIRKAVKGINAEAVVDTQPDPFAEALMPDRVVQAREFHLAFPVPQATTSATDTERIDSMGPLVAALQTPAGVAYTEVHVTIRPKRDTAHAKDSYTTTIRAIAIADHRDHVTSAWSALDQIGIALSRYRLRSVGQVQDQRIAAISRAGRVFLLILCTLLLSWLVWRLSPLPAPILAWLPVVLRGLLMLFGVLVLLRIRTARTRQKHRRLLLRAPRPAPPKLLAFWQWWTPPLILEAEALRPLYHLPTASLGTAIRWLPHRIIHPPAAAFIPATAIRLDAILASDPKLANVAPKPIAALPPQRVQQPSVFRWLRDILIPPGRRVMPLPPLREMYLPIGYGLRPDGSEGLVGILVHALRQAMAVAAPPGTGKTQFAIRLFCFVRALDLGLFGLDGKGDDRKGFIGKTRRMVTLADERNLIILDPRDDWTVSLNPLIGIDLEDDVGLDEALGMIKSIFARIDAEDWSSRMAGVLRKIIQLVLYGEPNPTLAHAKQALEDAAYRERLLPRCQERNIEVASFWINVASRSMCFVSSTAGTKPPIAPISLCND